MGSSASNSQCNSLRLYVKLTKVAVSIPTQTTCGSFTTNSFFSAASICGLFSHMLLISQFSVVSFWASRVCLDSTIFSSCLPLSLVFYSPLGSWHSSSSFNVKHNIKVILWFSGLLNITLKFKFFYTFVSFADSSYLFLVLFIWIREIHIFLVIRSIPFLLSSSSASLSLSLVVSDSNSGYKGWAFSV